jgi:hypothetical protein
MERFKKKWRLVILSFKLSFSSIVGSIKVLRTIVIQRKAFNKSSQELFLWGNQSNLGERRNREWILLPFRNETHFYTNYKTI